MVHDHLAKCCAVVLAFGGYHNYWIKLCLVPEEIASSQLFVKKIVCKLITLRKKIHLDVYDYARIYLHRSSFCSKTLCMHFKSDKKQCICTVQENGMFI